MTDRELENAIRVVSDQCDESRPQQQVKIILLSLLGAMASERQGELARVCAEFSEREIRWLTASRN